MSCRVHSPLKLHHASASLTSSSRALPFSDKLLEKEIALQEELFRALLDELMTGRLSTLPLVE